MILVENNREGWMIDDIILYGSDLAGGIDENDVANFTIYPNPMNSTITIELKDFYKDVELEILNSNGQLIEK